MATIERYQGDSPGRGVARQVGKSLARIEGETSIAIARVEARADIQVAQVDTVAAVAQRAMQGVAFLSQMEYQLGQAVPMAVSRLQAVGDIGALAMSQVVMDTASKLRRL